MSFHRISAFLITALYILISEGLHAQVVKVDLNFSGRNESEVHEPGYSSWVVSSGNSISYTEADVTFTFDGGFNSSWYKAGVQSPNFARLSNDGIQTSDITLSISGLPAGQHSLLTYHNSFHNPETNTFSNIEIYVGETLVHDEFVQSNRVLNDDDAAKSFVEFTIADGETAKIRYRVEPESQASDKTVYINGFALNTGDASRQPSFPYPKDLDEHANADNGSIILKWKPAKDAKSHQLYVGRQQSDVWNATPESSVFLGDLSDTSYQLSVTDWDTYYWRVDENYGADTVKGAVWSFKARHKAFDGAEGHGAFAQGGRGGKVVYVTNLNDEGPGSFREAVTGETGPRTVIFDVSGIVYLNSRVIMDDNLTIAGQTAPGKGICFRAAPIGIGDESIVRFMKMRLGAGTTYDGIGMAGANHSILDHSSISWTIDESFSSRGGLNITLQRTMLSEALNIANHQNYPAGTKHGYAATIGGSIGSFHHNLLAHNEGRNWSLGGGLDGNGYYAGELDIFNNVVYNWGGRATDGGAHEVNFVGNYYKKGPATSQNTILRAQLEGVGKGSQSYFYHNNIVENTNGGLACDGTNDACSREYQLYNGQVLDWQVFVDEPFFGSEANIQSASDAYKSVLSDVGATLPTFDDHDQRIIQETLNGSYTYRGSKSGKPGLIDHQDDAGGYEEYPELSREEGFDSDRDGLPDWWEIFHQTNVNSEVGDFSDANKDTDLDGYTDLEEYLMWMAHPNFETKNDSAIVIDLSQYTIGYTEDPQFEIVNANDLEITIQNEHEAKVSASENGVFSFVFKVKDSEGASMTREIGVLVGMNSGASEELNKEIEVDTASLTMMEGDAAIVLEVSLTSKPTGHVMLDITTEHSEEIFISPTSLTFTPENALVPQQVTLSTEDDITVEEEISSMISISVNSSSEDFLDAKTQSIRLILQDNDVLSGSNQHGILVYPNPVADVLTLKSDIEIKEVNIYSISGQLIKSHSDSGKVIEIGMSDVPKGVYLTKVISEKGTYQFKIFK